MYIIIKLTEIEFSKYEIIKYVLKNVIFFISIIIENWYKSNRTYKRGKNRHAKCLLLVHEDQHEPFAVVKYAAVSRRSKNRTFPRRARCAIRTMLLVWEMHSPLNVSHQPFRKRYKSRRAAPSAIFSRRISRRRRGRWYRRHCSGIKYPIESLIRQQTRPILGHLFAPTAMFALGAETRSVNRYFSAVRLCNIHRIRKLQKY